MPSFDASSSECQVFTFKQGLLSAVAHDLKLAVSSFSLEVDLDARTIEGRFAADSLEVTCAMRDGAEAPATLKDKDKQDIRKNLRKDVLKPAKHPEILFRGTLEASGAEVTGTLTLCGRNRDVRAPIERVGEHYVAEVRLNQPDFGIKPYSALFGTLKVKPEVLVQVRIPAASLPQT
ncbi:MAG: YceI family protein [Planctomycetota bacterium]|jgi:polyisoprenoid-binding protein YceI